MSNIKISEILLGSIPRQKVSLPEGSSILNVGVRQDTAYLVYIGDEDAPTDKQYEVLCFMGEFYLKQLADLVTCVKDVLVLDGVCFQYLNTVETYDKQVRHVFVSSSPVEQ